MVNDYKSFWRRQYKRDNKRSLTDSGPRKRKGRNVDSVKAEIIWDRKSILNNTVIIIFFMITCLPKPAEIEIEVNVA